MILNYLCLELTLNDELNLRVKENILKPDVYVPVSFINKYIRKHTVIPGVNNFTIPISLPTINLVRHIVLFFQAREIATYPTEQVFNNSIFNSPYSAAVNMIDISSIRAKVGGQTFYISDYTDNIFSSGHGSSFYNEFKRMRQRYVNDYRDTDMITYAEFINLYRIYCINVDCQTGTPYGTGSDVELQLTFNNPIPATAVVNINVYTITYSESDWEFKYDGMRQVTQQISMK